MITLTPRSFLKHIAALGVFCALPLTAAFAADPLFRGARVPRQWALWTEFQKIACRNGRVLLHDGTRFVTTSRAQGYGLFFALVADDRDLFDLLWSWTRTHLCMDPKGFRLAARLWGEVPLEKTERPSAASKRRKAADSVRIPEATERIEDVLDSGNDTHADLWIAYSLLEAARLWNEPSYRTDALDLLALLKHQCVRTFGTLGSVLLSSAHGGLSDDGSVVLEPGSYPLQILTRFSLEDSFWETVKQGCLRVILRSSPGGIVPDFARFSAQGFRLSRFNHKGNRKAIFAYLWAGMLSSALPERERLIKHFQIVDQFIFARKVPLGTTDAQKLSVVAANHDAYGSAFLAWHPDCPSAGVLRSYVQTLTLQSLSFSERVLVLFGLGFDRSLFAFDRRGRLIFPVVAGERK